MYVPLSIPWLAAVTLLFWLPRLLDAASLPSTCKHIPGDAGWPSLQTWQSLNQTVGGRLIATVPQAAVCHTGGYGPVDVDDAACLKLRSAWDAPQTFHNLPAELMNPFYQNQSCDPFTPASQPCELGNYVSFAINVSEPQHVVAGIKFAEDNNIRLVIKNTGHDFLGKSTGKGALSLWTHNLKTTKLVRDYKGSTYQGPAVQLGAGVQGSEAYMAVSAAGFRVVGGDCPTVGIAGGYTQGGGHSFLNSAHGMAADQVLEWEVVTAAGEHVVATPAQHEDLYWALSGGGPGTFAVVLSMTVKVFPEGPIGSASLRFELASVGSNETYLRAIEAWWAALPAIVDAGAVPLWLVQATAFTLQTITAPNRTAAQVTRLLLPFLTRLDALGVPYSYTAAEAPSYLAHFNSTNGPLPYGVYPASMIFNSRLIPRSVALDAAQTADLAAAMQSVVGGVWHVGCQASNVAAHAHPDNAVSPHWRASLAICITISRWNWTIPRADMLARQAHLANVIVPALDAVTPGSGAYLNEANPAVYPVGSTEWQDTFYGSTYPRLRRVKDTWDPRSLFYAYTAVGSEDWTTDGDGRLCRARPSGCSGLKTKAM